jgi:AAA family ATP:ADP antiporter
LGAFASLFGVTAGHTLLETTRDALFLARLPATRLPWVYIGIALAGLALAQLQAKVMRGRAQSRSSVAVSLLGAAAVTALFWRALEHGGTALLYALYVWTGLFASWITVQLWLLIGRFFTVTQAKRLFGVIGAGGVSGAVVGAAAARLAFARIAPAQGLLFASVVLVATAAPVALLQAPNAKDGAVARTRVARGTLAEGVRAIREQPYVRSLLLFMGACTMALTLADYAFKSAVVAHVPRAELGAYLGTVYSVLNALALVAQLVVAPWLLRTLGVSAVLWVMPALLAVGAGGVAFGGGLLAALALKGVDGTLRHSLHKTTVELLFVPIPDALRERVKPVVDLLAQRGGQAIVALLILATVELLGLGERALAAMSATLIVLWLLAIVSVRGRYLDNFRETLRAGSLASYASVPTLDLGMLETLFTALSSTRDRDVLAALELLAEQGRLRLVPAFILYHPAKGVVLRALELFADAGRADIAPVCDRLLSHPDPDVKAAALRARAKVAPDPVVLRMRLDDPSPEVRVTAAAALLARGWIGPGDARDATRAARQESKGSACLALARTVRQERSPALDVLLEDLATSDDGAVLNEVARTVAERKDPKFVPMLVPLLGRRVARGAARAALVAIGAPALEALDALLHDPATPASLRTHVPRTVCLIDPPEAAAAVLLEHLLVESDGHVRYKVLRGLSKLRQRAPAVPLDRAVLDRAIDEHLRAAFRLLAWRHALERGAPQPDARAKPVYQLLETLLRDKEKHATERLFRLFGLAFPGEDFERIYRGLRSREPKVAASSRELLENLVRPPRRAPTLALMDDAALDDRLAAAGPFEHEPPARYPELLAELADRGGHTIAALVSYYGAELGMKLEVPAPARDDHPDATSLHRIVAEHVRRLLPREVPHGAG